MFHASAIFQVILIIEYDPDPDPELGKKLHYHERP